jgi:acylphosphatase
VSVKRYRITGRVQGVGFRYFVWREAEGLGVNGWVRNRTDGTVEALVSGTEEQHLEIRQRLEEGPRWARVIAVEVTDWPGEFLARGFEIRRDEI